MSVSSAQVAGLQPSGASALGGVLATLYQYAKNDQYNRQTILANEVNRQVKELYNGDMAAFAQANPQLYQHWARTFRMPEDPGQMSLEGRYELDRRAAWDMIQKGARPWEIEQPPKPTPQPQPQPITPTPVPAKDVSYEGSSQRTPTPTPQTQPQVVPSAPPPPSMMGLRQMSQSEPNTADLELVRQLAEMALKNPSNIPAAGAEGSTVPGISQFDLRRSLSNKLNEIYTRQFGSRWVENPELLHTYQEKYHQLVPILESQTKSLLGTQVPAPEGSIQSPTEYPSVYAPDYAERVSQLPPASRMSSPGVPPPYTPPQSLTNYVFSSLRGINRVDPETIRRTVINGMYQMRGGRHITKNPEEWYRHVDKISPSTKTEVDNAIKYYLSLLQSPQNKLDRGY